MNIYNTMRRTTASAIGDGSASTRAVRVHIHNQIQSYPGQLHRSPTSDDRLNWMIHSTVRCACAVSGPSSHSLLGVSVQYNRRWPTIARTFVYLFTTTERVECSSSFPRIAQDGAKQKSSITHHECGVRLSSESAVA